MRSEMLRSIGFAGGLMVMMTSALGQGAPKIDPPPSLTAAQASEMLQRGGYVVFIRHGATEKDYADQVRARMGDCSSQRALSEVGWQQAKAIGAGFRNAGVPVHSVVSSQYCRAWQTAEIAFGRHEKTPALNFEKAKDYTKAQSKVMRDNVSPLLGAVPPANSNTVLVGHDDPFEAATGYYPEPMGVMVIVKPDGKGGHALVGRVPPEAWGVKN